MSEAKRYTLAILVDNEAGVLSQISRLFSRKGFNIESLSVGTVEIPNTSRITVEIIADEDQVTLMMNQVRKLFPVHSVKLLEKDNSIRRELVLIKVKAENSAKRNEVIQIANIFRASIIDVSVGALTLAMIGSEQKTDAIERILDEFEVIEMARTGIVAIERGKETIYDNTKEKGEFNYGKNVL